MNKISLIIATYQRPSALQLALASALRQTRRPDQIIVAAATQDDLTTDAVGHFIDDHPDAPVQLVLCPIGVTAQENAGLAAAHGDILCFIDDDVAVPPDWLESLERHYTDPAVGGVGGRDVNLTEGQEVRTATRVGHITWYGRVTSNHHLQGPRLQDVQFLKGCNMSYRRKFATLIDANLLGQIPYGFEIDMGLAARARGARIVYDPDLAVIHRATSDMSPYQAWLGHLVNHNSTYILLKHMSWQRRLAFLAYTFLVGDRDCIGLIRIPMLVGKGWTAEAIASHFRGKCAGVRTFLACYRSTRKPTVLIEHRALDHNA